MFNFDVHDDVRLLADATKEKDESHAGKVVERSWYQRNKHIFPASRWEVSPMHPCILTRADSLTYLLSRCLTRRKTMANIPSLRLYEDILVSRTSLRRSEGPASDPCVIISVRIVNIFL